MLLYSDIFCDDELISDSYKMENIDDIVYKVESKKVKKGGDEDYGISNNAEEEEGGAGGSGASAEMVNEIVQSFNLNEIPYTKKEYLAHIKDYMKRLKEHLEKN
ncbi:hypothetical protein AKO1_011567 [Acrasis kona]|uniref:TCTP domain-containing protein n=1 Tax=Acrasis kona TaxID=1008807 RepID=A0AAW2ZL70_9EUKA